MSKRNRGMLVLSLLACLAVVGLAVYLLLGRSAINSANFEKIQIGMTQAQVEGILGGPERDESTGPLAVDPAVGDRADALSETRLREVSVFSCRRAVCCAGARGLSGRRPTGGEEVRGE